MQLSTAKKLKIKEGQTLLTVHAPADFENKLAPIPKAVTISTKAKAFDQVHWFVTNKAGMEKDLKKVLPMIKGEIVCWIYYPKSRSKIQTDLSRDKGWDELLKNDLQWLSLISFDETWSAFGMRQKTEKEK
jgi:hypothetical protein